MESLVIKMAARVLRHRGICFAFVGEIALNYYNVPRVRHVCHLTMRPSRPKARPAWSL